MTDGGPLDWEEPDLGTTIASNPYDFPRTIKRPKVIQLATSACAPGKGFDEIENLYALDTEGRIWLWHVEDEEFTWGWEELPDPWNNLRQKKEKK